MDIASLIAEIDAKIARLETARNLLAGTERTRKVGRPKKTAPRRVLSADAKERIAAAQRKRWAKVRKAAQKTPATEARKITGLNKTTDVTLKRGVVGVAQAERGSLKKLPGKRKPPTATQK